MKKQILVPLDGSHLAETAIPHALALASAQDCNITLLCVIPTPLAVIDWGMAPTAALWDRLDEEIATAEEYLERMADRLVAETSGQRVTVNRMVLKGDPAANIISYVGGHPEVLVIAMTTHGRSGLSRWVFGSVAEKVLHNSPVPLMLVRHREGESLPEHFEVPRYEALLVPLDGSDFAAQALPYAEHIALVTKADITLLSAVPDAPMLTDLVAPPVIPFEWEDETERFAAYLDETARDLRARGFISNTCIDREPPADAILHYVRVKHPSLIVMSTHGRSGLSRLWLGSVAVKVVQAAGCPVLMVRAKTSVGEAGDEKEFVEAAV